MVGLRDFLKECNILDCFRSDNKAGALKELLDLLVKSGHVNTLQKRHILKKLLEREALGSTALGQGFALPHAKIKNLDKTLVCVGVSKKGVDFDSLDGDPVRVIFLLLVNEQEFGLHLKLLASCARILRDKFFRKKIMEANGCKSIHKLIKGYGEANVR